MPFMDEAEDGAEEDVEDTEDEPTSLIALFLKKTKIKAFLVINKKGQQWPSLLLLDIRTQSFIPISYMANLCQEKELIF